MSQATFRAGVGRVTITPPSLDELALRYPSLERLLRDPETDSVYKEFVIAYEQGIQMSQASGLELVDYPNLISCRVHWAGGSRTMAGVIFAGGEPRLVQYDAFRIDAKPEGYVLVLENEDVPGVMGRVGALLGRHNVNIGEWRLARNQPGGHAVSFINVDSAVPAQVLDELRREPAIAQAKVIKL